MKWFEEVCNFVAGLPSTEEVERALNENEVVLDRRKDVGVALAFEELSGVSVYERRYMHRSVNDRLFSVEVVPAASAELLSEQLSCDKEVLKQESVVYEEDGAKSTYKPRKTSTQYKTRRRMVRLRPLGREAVKEFTLSKPACMDEVALALRQGLVPDENRDRCGFSEGRGKVVLSCSRHLAEVKDEGMHTVVSAGSVKHASAVFFEVAVIEQASKTTSAHCGMTVGLLDMNHKENSFGGDYCSSLGFSCDGTVASGTFERTHNFKFFAGDTVGLLVKFPESLTGKHPEFAEGLSSNSSSSSSFDEGSEELCASPILSSEGKFAHVTIFVNGSQVVFEPIPFLVEGVDDIRAAVFLSRQGVKAEIRCCPVDMRMVPWDCLPLNTVSLSQKSLSASKRDHA
ncbi:hypothetical protein NDN08_003727 [Rhodosorus marinus]|uniref:SPRY domain-containing protein n=1 Tax=Rhodosorus marinus TaxID=101924 RepID=A0AAV8V073_9RHOD|nr:hypothetical protein NDN08_003727 [Rhodosorus marinus]